MYKFIIILIFIISISALIIACMAYTKKYRDEYFKADFSIDLDTIEAGLSHQKSNLDTLIKYCYKNNLNLVKPIFNLAGFHNNGNSLKSDLSKYYDLNNILVNDKPFKMINKKINTYTIPKKEYPWGLLSGDNMFKDIGNSKISIKYNSKIINIAKKISKILNNNYLCIHR